VLLFFAESALSTRALSVAARLKVHRPVIVEPYTIPSNTG
jgi:hypothetical protein